MTEIVVILLSVVISAVVSIILRMSERDKNSMDKVKRYANQKMADFRRP